MRRLNSGLRMNMPLKKITPEQLMQKMQQKEQLVILDVRDEAKYNNFHIEGDNI